MNRNAQGPVKCSQLRVSRLLLSSGPQPQPGIKINGPGQHFAGERVLIGHGREHGDAVLTRRQRLEHPSCAPAWPPPRPTWTPTVFPLRPRPCASTSTGTASASVKTPQNTTRPALVMSATRGILALRRGRVGILAAMRSTLGHDVSRRRQQRLAALTPAERVALAIRLGEEGLASFMAVHRVDRETARARIAATRRVGRRRSAASEAADK